MDRVVPKYYEFELLEPGGNELLADLREALEEDDHLEVRERPQNNRFDHPSNSVKFWRPAGPSVKSVKFRQIPSNFRPRWGPYYPPLESDRGSWYVERSRKEARKADVRLR